VFFHKGKQQITIAMCGWGMLDSEMGRWCEWFRGHLIRSRGGSREPIAAKEVNFAENRLTAYGVRTLLSTLSECRVAVHVLKLHHNRLEGGSAIADLIMGSAGSLAELHLSHNKLGTAAAAEIIMAAAQAKDEEGQGFCYPRQAASGGVIPLWLRIEQNYVDHVLLNERLEAATGQLQRPGKVLCNGTNKGCTPHSCVRNRRGAPAIHVKQLTHQRCKEEAEAPLPAGRLTVAPENGDGAPPVDVAPEPRPGEAFVADVLRWDEKLFRWVRDVIEVPAAPAPEPKEVMAQELRNLIGMRCAPPPVLPRAVSAATRPSPSSPPPSGSSLLATSIERKASGPAALVARGPAVTEGEHAFRGGTIGASSSRRGLQPSGGEVKRSNGSHLNPQAPQFIPGAYLAEAKTPTRPTLDPSAMEFTPSALRSSRWSEDTEAATSTAPVVAAAVALGMTLGAAVETTHGVQEEEEERAPQVESAEAAEEAQGGVVEAAEEVSTEETPVAAEVLEAATTDADAAGAFVEVESEDAEEVVAAPWSEGGLQASDAAVMVGAGRAPSPLSKVESEDAEEVVAAPWSEGGLQASDAAVMVEAPPHGGAVDDAGSTAFEPALPLDANAEVQADGDEAISIHSSESEDDSPTTLPGVIGSMLMASAAVAFGTAVAVARRRSK